MRIHKALIIAAALSISIAAIRFRVVTTANQKLDRLAETTTPTASATPSPTATSSVTPTPSTSASPTPSASPSYPAHRALVVPFQVQAPNANWDPLHEDACEEASLIMVAHFMANTDITDGEGEIQSLVAYETTQGMGYSVTLDDLNKVAASQYNLTTGRIVKNPSVAQIKTEIAAGRPVIIPAAGQLLENPNFKQPGPVYHMLVLTGYTETTFISNDPGTRKGQDYEYPTQTLMRAIHDWNPDNILDGTPSYLVFD